MIHSSQHVAMSTNGSVMKEGYSNQLAPGQIGIASVREAKRGLGNKIIPNFEGFSKRVNMFTKRFQLQVGTVDREPNMSMDNHNQHTVSFDFADIVEVGYVPIGNIENKVDIVRLGFDGRGIDGTIKLKPGEVTEISIKLSGQPIYNLGIYNKKECYDFSIRLSEEDCRGDFFNQDCAGDCDPCSNGDCYALTMKAIEKIENHILIPGGSNGTGLRVKDVINVRPIVKFKVDPDPVPELNMIKWCLEICDDGTQNALSAVQSQYPGVIVERVGRTSSISKYQIISPEYENDEPIVFEDYVENVKDELKGCAACEGSKVEQPGGILYRFVIEDFGNADLGAIVETIFTNLVAGTTTKYGTSNPSNFGNYYIILDGDVLPADEEAFNLAYPTGDLVRVGKVEAVCTEDNLILTPWVQCGSCTYSKEDYVIALPDLRCDGQSQGDRLAELQAVYPDLEITLYDDTETPTVYPSTGGCNTAYKTSVITNVKCEGCSQEEVKVYESEAPFGYEGNTWEKLSNLIRAEKANPDSPNYLDPNNPENEDELKKGKGLYCGIEFEGKVKEDLPSRCLSRVKNGLSYNESSVKIQVSGGLISEYTTGRPWTYGEMFKVTRIQEASEPRGKGGSLWDSEDYGKILLQGEHHVHTTIPEIYYTGEDRLLEVDKTYVEYFFTVKKTALSQSVSLTNTIYTTYHLRAELGAHKDMQDLVNAIASAADLDPVNVA